MIGVSGGATVETDVKAGMDCGMLPTAIFSASFSAERTAVGLRRFLIQFCVVCECVCLYPIHVAKRGRKCT